MNTLDRLALTICAAFFDTLPDKNWLGYLIMDAAMFRYLNPSNPYTDISQRALRFLIKKTKSQLFAEALSSQRTIKGRDSAH